MLIDLKLETAKMEKYYENPRFTLKNKNTVKNMTDLP